MPSPCGVNCSYVIEFEGPYMICNTTTTSTRFDDAGQVFPVFTGIWTQPFGSPLNPALRSNSTYTQARFNSTTLFPLEVNVTNSGLNSSVVMQQDNTICLPARAKYTVNNTYHDNVLHRNISSEPIDRLTNLVIRSKDGSMRVPGFILPLSVPPALGIAPANWSTEALAFYRDNNMITILASMMSLLNGTFEGYLPTGTGLTTQGPGQYESYLLQWNELVATTTSGINARFGGAFLTISGHQYPLLTCF